jgi:molybdopterin molybdotransferase
MHTFKEALEVIIGSARFLGTEKVEFLHSLNRVLAEDVFSDVDMPPFDKAAMDGFACRGADLGAEMTIVETIPAGVVPQISLEPGQCSRIMTGAMLPEGADTVIMVEQSKITEYGKVQFTASHSSPNIAYQGEDVKKGDLMLQAGQVIHSSRIAIMAAVGCVSPVVSLKPRVGILSTGNELVEPFEIPGDGMIRNSNAWQLMAQVRNCGAIANYLGIVPDTEEDTEIAISNALSRNDVVIFTGGVSMGDYDFVPAAMEKNNVKILFQRVAVKPGRPTVFGMTDNAWIFGLPGNPVSSFINFEVFVKPLLYHLMGHSWTPFELKLKMGAPYTRKKADRLEWVPVDFSPAGEVVPVSYHGSAHIHAVSLSKAIMEVPVDIYEFKKGEIVNVRPL